MGVQANLTSKLYGLRSSGISHGDVFTSPVVVNFMLDLIGYTSDKNLSLYKLLEPSFGHGDFLIEIQRRIIQSAGKFNFNASAIMSDNIYGSEIDGDKYNTCIETLKLTMPDFVPSKLKNEDFLFSTWDTKFDFIIGNPPYIRYENIPKNLRDSYKVKFATFYYRCDLYVLFYEQCLNNLSDNGRHCFICSNRWLKNEYGKKLRALISSFYKLEYIIDIEGIDVFKESVLAYPSITLILNTESDNKVNVTTIRDLSELNLPLSSTRKEILSIENWNNLFVNEDLDNLTTVEEQGFKVGIGVATGADNIYISTDLKDIIETELLIPIVNAKDLSGNVFNPKGLYLLNPYDSNGNIINLNNYPKAKSYLEKFRIILENRHIVKKGRTWYALIDRIKPELLNEPKILLPDISGNNIIFIDHGLFYPAHNIYYITGKSLTDLEQLAALLMSEFVRNQIEGISNKMNGGIPRWQSQSIKQIRIPRLSTITPNLREKMIAAYHKGNINEINSIVEEIVRMQFAENKQRRQQKFPESLFDYDFL